MQNSGLISSWQAELKKSGIPATSASQAAQALCRVIDHQFYLRDNSHGDLYRMYEKSQAEIAELKSRLQKVEHKEDGA